MLRKGNSVRKGEKDKIYVHTSRKERSREKKCVKERERRTMLKKMKLA